VCPVTKYSTEDKAKQTEVRLKAASASTYVRELYCDKVIIMVVVEVVEAVVAAIVVVMMETSLQKIITAVRDV
jgi:hypothetical protein